MFKSYALAARNAIIKIKFVILHLENYFDKMAQSGRRPRKFCIVYQLQNAAFYSMLFRRETILHSVLYH